MIRLKNIDPNTLIVFLGIFSWFATIPLAMPVWANEQTHADPEFDQSTSTREVEVDRPTVQPAAGPVETIPTVERTQIERTQTNEAIRISETKQLIEAVQANHDALLPIDPHPTGSGNEPEPTSNTIGQLTSASQLSDVQPTDWAYQALQSLVERYGCIVGYPDETYRGQRALSRFEFAAGVNACLDQINELLAASTADLATKEDLATLQRLQEEFAAELAQLRGRVDVLEARTSELEANQFSTTVKLSGSAIMALSDAFVDGSDNQLIGQYRYRLLLNASFTGRDSLLMGIYAGNAIGNGFDTGGFDLPGLEVTAPDGSLTETISTQEGGLTSTTGATTDNELLFLAAGYSFPVGDRLMVNVGTGRNPYYFYAPVLNGLYTSDEGTGAIGTFARHDPVYLLAGGGTGVVFNYDIGNSLQLAAGYLADGGTVNNPAPGNGLFNGGYGVLGQLSHR